MTHWKSVLGVHPCRREMFVCGPACWSYGGFLTLLEEAWEGESRTRPSRVARTEVIDP